MKVVNKTRFCIENLIHIAVDGFCVDDLIVEVKYCPKGSRRYISGTYYRYTKKHKDGKFIRLRINESNRYPITISFKTSEYEKKRGLRGQIITYQKLKKVEFTSAEDLMIAIFLHEFSHYLDHMQGLNGSYKQTKADKFAVQKLEQICKQNII